LTVEINAKSFVEWIFRLPLKKLTKPMRAADWIAVSRRLGELAKAKPEFNFLSDLAADIWKLLVYLPDGPRASNERCMRFLDEFEPFFPTHDLKKALAALKDADDVPVQRFSKGARVAEYRIVESIPFVPAVVQGPKRSKRPPTDDISERIGVAIDAMKEAECSRHLARVAEALEPSELLPAEYCTIPHITSRYKSLGARIPLSQQEVPMWLMSYWHSLHPEYASKTWADPEWPQFVFQKCDC
jgi:hypothetical protein